MRRSTTRLRTAVDKIGAKYWFAPVMLQVPELDEDLESYSIGNVKPTTSSSPMGIVCASSLS
jgi:hypothetical protein